jgi:AcrR family transcriptional regulator
MEAVKKQRAPRDPGRNRAAIVDALLAALLEGETHPTARKVADRAGVSLRSIYVHFTDLDEVRLEAAHVQAERIRSRLPAIEPTEDGRIRVGRLCDALDDLYPHQGPVRLAATVDAMTSEPMRLFLAEGERQFRSYLRLAFPELDGSSRLETLQALTNPVHRYLLIHSQQLSERAASVALRDAMTALIAPAGPDSA